MHFTIHKCTHKLKTTNTQRQKHTWTCVHPEEAAFSLKALPFWMRIQLYLLILHHIGSKRCNWMARREWRREGTFPQPEVKSQKFRKILTPFHSSLDLLQERMSLKKDYHVIAIIIVQCEQNPPFQSSHDINTLRPSDFSRPLKNCLWSTVV